MITNVEQEAARLKIFLERNNIKQIEVARLLDIPKSSMTRYLKGISQLPTEHALVLRDKYNLSLNWFYAGSGYMVSKKEDDRNLITDIAELRAHLEMANAKIKRLEDNQKIIMKQLGNK